MSAPWLLGMLRRLRGEPPAAPEPTAAELELRAALREAEEARRRAAIVMDQVRRRHQHWLERALVPPRDAHHGQGPTP